MKAIHQKNTCLSFSNRQFIEFASLAYFALLAAMLILGIFEPSSAATNPQALPVEVLEQPTPEQQSGGVYDPEKLEQTRQLTPTRIATLVVMWIIIIVLVITVEIYLRRQEYLIKRGYYNSDLT